MNAVLAATILLCPNGIGPVAAEGDRPKQAQPAQILCVSPRADGQQLLVGDSRGQLRRFRLEAGQPPRELGVVGTLPGAITGLVRDGDRVCASDDQGHLALVTTTVERFARHAPGVQALALRDGLLVAAGTDGTLTVFKPHSKQQHTPLATMQAHTGPVAGVAFAGRHAVISVGWDGWIKRWTLPRSLRKPGSRPRGRVRARFKLQHSQRELTAVAATPDGRWIVTAGHDGVLTLWKPERKKLVPTVVGARSHQEWVRSVVLRADGRQALAVAPAESALVLIDVGGTTQTLAQAKPPTCATYLPDGRLVVGRFDGQLTVTKAAPGGNAK